MSKESDIWLGGVRGCKKIKNNRVKITTKFKINEIFENIKNSHNHNNYKIEQINDVYDDFSYKLEKNKSLGIDRNTDRKLRTGEIKIDMRIDFHGLTLAQAFDTLMDCVNYAYARGLKCLLVVTGKGINTHPNRDSIKSQFEKWMRVPQIASKVIKYVDATPKHGGSGAVYLLLKTNRQPLMPPEPLP
ncbi:hypothetical protein FACS1894152_3050 [Bacilli bacterium]|nr:hypothetical protein FACS1894152_3050 [Bacilli bacterium]